MMRANSFDTRTNNRSKKIKITMYYSLNYIITYTLLGLNIFLYILYIFHISYKDNVIPKIINK